MSAIIRPLNSNEKIGLIYEKTVGYNLVFAIRLYRSIRQYDVVEALKFLLQYYVPMRLQIDAANTLYIDPTNYQIKVTTEIAENKQSWEKVVQQEYSRPLAWPGEELYSIKLLEAKKYSDIIVTISHIIADGPSAVTFALDLVQLLNKKSPHSIFRKTNTIQDPILPSSLDFDCDIDNIPTEHIKNLLATQRAHAITANYAGIYRKLLSKWQTWKLLRYCKRHKISLHNIISAVASKALSKHYEYKSPIVWASLIDTRRNQLHMPNLYQLGDYHSHTYHTFQPVELDEDNAKLAITMRQLLKKSLVNNEQIKAIQNKIHQFNQASSLSELDKEHCFNYPTLNISTNYTTSGNGEFLGCITSYSTGPCLNLQLINIVVNKQLYLFFQYCVDDEVVVKKLGDEITANLLNL